MARMTFGKDAERTAKTLPATTAMRGCLVRSATISFVRDSGLRSMVSVREPSSKSRPRPFGAGARRNVRSVVAASRTSAILREEGALGMLASMLLTLQQAYAAILLAKKSENNRSHPVLAPRWRSCWQEGSSLLFSSCLLGCLFV